MSATSGRPKYIERYAILNIVNDAVSHNALSYEGCVNEIIERIAQTQSADVVERKCGKWMPSSRTWSYYNYDCSVCGCNEFRQVDHNGGYKAFNFCPNCGADMRVEQDE